MEIRIELDYSNLKRMRMTAIELESAHQMVKNAIAAAPKVEAELGEKSPADQARDAISSMANRFKSSEVYNHIPDVLRSVVKDTFRQYVDKGWLKVIEQGEGSRPTVYEKTLLLMKHEVI